MNLEKQKENFKNHRATFKDLGNIKILDFKKPNSTEVSFQVSKRTAKNKQRRLGGKIMNYAWDANCDGIEITEEDVDYLMKAIDLALHRIKQKNKEKYTPKKYK